MPVAIRGGGKYAHCRINYVWITLALVISSANDGAGESLRTVALTGQSGIGTQSEFASTPGLYASLNNVGQVTFASRLNGPADSDSGVWLETDGVLSLLVREGMQMSNGTTLGAVGRSRVNDAGEVIFSSSGYWSNAEGGQFQTVVTWTTPPPGVPIGALFSGINGGDHFVAFNNQGRIAFQGEMVVGVGGVTRHDNSGVWSSGIGTLSLVARQGFPAADSPTGGLYFALRTPLPLNDQGEVAFTGSFYRRAGFPTDDSYQNGIWIGGSDGVRAVALGGQQATGIPGALFDNDGYDFSVPRLNSSGFVAFVANLQEGSAGVTELNDSALWSEGDGSLKLIAREGSLAPGAPLEATFAGFTELVLNDAGHVVFSAGLSLNDQFIGNSLWSDIGGSPAMMFSHDSPAPGTSGATFSFFRELVLNSNDQLAFLGILEHGVAGVSSSNDRGLWAQNDQGVLQLIAREGDQIDVDNSVGVDWRTISELDFIGNTGNGDGYATGFNDSGEIVFAARFTDGSQGVFIADVNAGRIPEPAFAVLFLGAGVTMIARQRRRPPCG